MCGIAGVFYKEQSEEHDVGKALVEMLYGCQHRGRDSTGFALYGEPAADQLVIRFLIGEGDVPGRAVERIGEILAEHGAELVEDGIVGHTYRARVSFTGDVRQLSYDLERAHRVISIGTSLEIIKDVGDAREVDERFGVQGSAGTHGIGHVRLATESDVKPEAAHPFWATGFADIAIVHNGQITNYWKKRRALESKGYEFGTDNDSELIAVLLAEQQARGIGLRQALEASIEELDGTFSFLVSTRDELGFAKDHLAAKPMVMCETDALVAIASEEVSLNRLFPGETISTTEPLPGTCFTWTA